MMEYKLDDATREIMAKHHRQVQWAIAQEANRLMGVELPNRRDEPQGIYKYEGGVVVNKCEICIKYDFLCDDWKRTTLKNPTPEEKATVQAISIVADICRNDIKQLEKYGSCRFGDPLRSMLEEKNFRSF